MPIRLASAPGQLKNRLSNYILREFLLMKELTKVTTGEMLSNNKAEQQTI